MISEKSFTLDGRTGSAITINGTIPGPLIRLKEGQEVTLRVTNQLEEISSIHWHGILLPSHMDGVPGVSFAGIRPGETFSIWRMVGRPTAARGFLEGLVLSNGKIEKGIGGGLCQLGNLLYWMALHSPLTVAERYRHGFDVFPDINRSIPFACGATLAYNYIDLQLKNDTSDSFQINLWLDGEFLHGEILSSREPEWRYEVYETDHLIKLQPWGGYTRHNRIWRRQTSLVDGWMSESLVTENHAVMMYNPLLTA